MKYGLVISGGGANGLFSIQIIQKLIKDGLSLDDVPVVSGVSVGSMIGAMIAQNDFQLIFDKFPNIKNNQIFSGKFNIWYALYNRILGRNYVLDISPLKTFLTKYIDLDKAKKSNKIFYIGVTNFESGLYEELTQFDFDNNEDYINAILASGSQPIIWKNISFNTNKRFIEHGYDGGVIHVSPINSVLQHDVDELIIINNAPSDIVSNPNLKYTENVLLRMIDIFLNSSFNKDLKTFIRINEIVQRFGKYNDKKYFPYTLYQTTVHSDSLDFESTKLITERINDANQVYSKNNTNK
jgi:predicted acylesterase/phospholipase RssA